jgi:hypothetical protein
MSSTIGDGIVVIGLAAGIVGYVYIQHQTRRKRLELIHQERLVAMEKGIPLPEFPLENPPKSKVHDPDEVIPILGMVLLTLSLGTMILLYLILAASEHALWISPLPLAFLGAGFIAFHLLKRHSNRG